MRLRKEAFGAIVQTNVASFTENIENIGAAVSSKYGALFPEGLFSTIHGRLSYSMFQ